MGIFKDFHGPTVYFSDCHHTPIYDERHHLIGKLDDFFVDYEERYPTVLAVLIKQGKQFKYINWNEIKSFSYKKIIISQNSEIKSLLWSQIINGPLIPIILIYIINLCNDPEIMGEYTNSTGYNFICYSIVIIMLIANGSLIYYEFLSK